MHKILQSAENRPVLRTGRRRPTLAIALAVLALLLMASAPTAQTVLAPYVATPSDVVDRMLAMAAIRPEDVVYDLGCGDGRLVIEAARQFGARGVGIDIDAELVRRATENAVAAGVQHRVTFRVQDAMTVDLSDATVVTLYLLAASNAKLRPILERDLRPGSRIVSHNFPIGDWQPTRVETFTSADGKVRTLYLWSRG